MQKLALNLYCPDAALSQPIYRPVGRVGPVSLTVASTSNMQTRYAVGYQMDSARQGGHDTDSGVRLAPHFETRCSRTPLKVVLLAGLVPQRSVE